MFYLTAESESAGMARPALNSIDQEGLSSRVNNRLRSNIRTMIRCSICPAWLQINTIGTGWSDNEITSDFMGNQDILALQKNRLFVRGLKEDLS